MNSFLGPTLEQ